MSKEFAEKDMTNSRKHSEICIDDLTGLPGGPGLSSSITGGVLVFIELENYAAICRRHGNKAGNTSLLLLARSLQDQLCDKEEVFRISGGVFVLLLEGAGLYEAASRGQSVVKRLNRISWVCNEEEISLYTSIFIKPFGANDPPDKCIEIALAAEQV